LVGGFGVLMSCAPKKDNPVVFYLTSEDFRSEYFQNRLKEQFPDYEVVFNYDMPGGTF
jgi:hypothetical protein